MTRDAVEIIDREFGKDDPEWEAGVIEEGLKVRVGQMVYDIRTELKLTQAQLGKRVGTSRSVISKLENADYEGSALEMLWRICLATGRMLNFSATHATKAA
jgi:DNA-binding XRE family transcriptional regulator